VNDEGSASDSVSDYSTDSENYDQLLIAFKETHDEANRLVVVPTSSSCVMTCFARARVGRAQWNT